MMKKLFLLLAFAGLLSCGPNSPFVSPNVAADAVGQYPVTAYILDKDTLFAAQPFIGGSNPGINKLGVDSFFIKIDESSGAEMTISTTYWQKGIRYTFSKQVKASSLNDYYYGFSPLKEFSPSVYDAKFQKSTKVFLERTVGEGVVISMPNSSTSSVSSKKEVIIVAGRR